MIGLLASLIACGLQLLLLGVVGMVLEICIALRDGWSGEAEEDESCDSNRCAADLGGSGIQGSAGYRRDDAQGRR